ncbi:sialin-like isoform X3 [Antedon mediterranea]|uniref:sialin-like isoform X3 n=1 Tax=Antedon mediterranea TaxID=105859 RepID=UPI003AF6BB81
MPDQNLIEKQPFLRDNDNSRTLKIRYVITFLCFVGSTLIYAARVNWSIAILYMARQESDNTNSTDSEVNEGSSQIVYTFDWNMKTQQIILGSFYCGYSVGPILGGWLVGRFGGFSMLMTGILFTTFPMLVTQFAAHFGVGFVILTRIIDGFGQGIAYPANLVLIRNWSKADERNTLLAIAFSGCSVGPILTSYISTWLCSSEFMGGWPSTFYLYGTIGVVWCVVWCIVGSKTNMQSNLQAGLLNMAPHLCVLCMTVIGGLLGDYLISHDKLSILGTRRLLNTFCFGLTAVFIIILGYVYNSDLSLTIMVFAFGIYGFKFAGVNANVLDIAPFHSGIIIGMMISIGSIGGLVATTLLGVLTETNNTLRQWRVEFWTQAALQICALLAFFIFGSDKPQEWAKPPEESADIERQH